MGRRKQWVTAAIAQVYFCLHSGVLDSTLPQHGQKWKENHQCIYRMKIQKGRHPRRKGKGQHHMLPKGLGNEADSKPGVDQTKGSEPAKV